jgi:hypothetical protein
MPIADKLAELTLSLAGVRADPTGHYGTLAERIARDTLLI